MKERTRNVSVGVTVIVALAMLAGMILLFAGLPEAFQTGYTVRMQSTSAHDLHEGDPVYLSGMRVGRVIRIAFSDPRDPGRGVTITARIEGDINLPGDAKAVVFTRGFVGSPYLAIVGGGPERLDAAGQPLRFLPPDGSAVIAVHHDRGGMFPAEFTDAIGNLAKLAGKIDSLLGPAPGEAPTTTPATGPAEPPPGLRGAIVRLNRTLDALHTVVGDADNQANIHASLANLAEATAKASATMDALKAMAGEISTQARQAADRAGEAIEGVSTSLTKTSDTARRRIDELAERVGRSADSLSTLMATLNKFATKLQSGEGTGAKLANDPKLYNNLVEAAAEMTKLMADLRELVDTWKRSGVELKLK